jgi:hypothetical protein
MSSSYDAGQREEADAWQFPASLVVNLGEQAHSACSLTAPTGIYTEHGY